MRRGSRYARERGHTWVALLLMLTLGPLAAARAGSFDLGDVHADYKLTVNYGVAIRMKQPDDALINGPERPE